MTAHGLVVFTAAAWLVLVALALPGVASRPIVGCASGNAGSLSYSASPTERFYWGGGMNGCVSNTVTGLSSVTSFTYYPRRFEAISDWDESAVIVLAVVIDATTNSVVASIDISSQFTTTEVQEMPVAVTASFPDVVPLDALNTYKLAFCLPKEGLMSGGYNFVVAASTLDAIQVCFEDDYVSVCSEGGAIWSDDTDVLKTEVNGGCIALAPSITPSTSPSAPPSRSPSRSPSASPQPQALLACVGDVTGALTVDSELRFGFVAWGGEATQKCNANAVRGLSSLSSFTYYLKRDGDGPSSSVTAMAHVIDATDNSVVASVDVSSQLSRSFQGGAAPVTATFAGALTLDKLRTYRLAFCLTSELLASQFFYFEGAWDATPTRNAIWSCFEEPGKTCPSGGGQWNSYGNVFRSVIDGGCSLPSPSRTPSNSPANSPSPSVSPRAMVACAGDNAGSLTFANAPAERAYWGGGEATTCVSNTIIGLSTLSNFTYYLRRDQGADSSVKASAFVVDSVANSVVASVNISTLLSTTAQSQAGPVMATFASAVTLNKRKTYKLAFCLTPPLSGAKFNFQYTSELDVMEVCTPGSGTATCPIGGGAWSGAGSQVLRTDVSGGCIEPSPSRTPSITPSISRSPSNTPPNSPSRSRTPTRSPSPSNFPQAIVACAGGNNGAVTYAGGSIDQAFWGEGLSIAGDTCYSNSVVGLTTLSSFTFYLRSRTSIGLLQALGVVIDATANNSLVASVDITSLLVPTESNQYVPVTATFANVVILDKLHTYRLAFCATALTGNTDMLDTLIFSMAASNAANAFRACTSVYEQCTGVLSDEDGHQWSLPAAVDNADALADADAHAHADAITNAHANAIANANACTGIGRAVDLALAVDHAVHLGFAVDHAVDHAFDLAFAVWYAVNLALPVQDVIADTFDLSDAIAHAFGLAFSLANSVDDAVALAHSFANALDLAIALAFSFANAFAIGLAFSLAYAITLAFSLANAFSICHSFSLAFAIAFSLSFANAYALDLAFPLAYSLTLSLAHAIALARSFANALRLFDLSVSSVFLFLLRSAQ